MCLLIIASPITDVLHKISNFIIIIIVMEFLLLFLFSIHYHCNVVITTHLAEMAGFVFVPTFTIDKVYSEYTLGEVYLSLPHTISHMTRQTTERDGSSCTR